MTDHKAWLWRKKPSEKTIVVAEKVDQTSRENEEEIRLLLAEKAELERDLRDISDKLSSSLTECDAKDDLAKKHAKTAQEALAGWEKAEAKVLLLKQDLDEALKQRQTSEERTHHLDAALKECMQQLRYIREDQEQRINDVLLKASVELEETKMFLEQELAESVKKVENLTAENSQLNNVLLLKEQLIEDLNQQMAKAEGNVHALLARLESMDKENNSLRYEVRILEKEVDIRNEEREFSRRTADAAHKQHLENVKKIAKLESECQRLRVLVRKRLPGPAALAKMKSEVDMLQRDPVGNRRKKSNSNISNLQLDYSEDNYPQSPSKKINPLMERICTLEEENISLRETLQKKLNELQISRNMYVQTASKLSQVEAQVEESPKSQIGDIRRRSMVYDASLGSMSDVGSDDKVSCAGSWATALISELEHFRDGKDKVASPYKSVGMSNINQLMGDFAEMEKLAIVCADQPIENSSATNSETHENSLLDTTGKELVSVPSLPSKLNISISKLIEIIKGINLPSQDYGVLQTLSGESRNYTTPSNTETSTDYLVRVFQWKTSELTAILQNFLHTCNDLLHGKADLEIFTRELTSSLEWIINHCFSLQDVASMKDAIRKQFDWDETRSDTEIEAGLCGIVQFPGAAKSSVSKELLLCSPLNASNGYHNEAYCDMSKAAGGKFKDVERNMDCVKQELNLQFAGCDSKPLRNQLQESESTIGGLQAEVEGLKHSKAMIEDQFESQKKTIEDLNSALSALRSELDEAYQKVTSLEAELENKIRNYEELEAKCIDLQLQLEERMTNMDTTEHVNQGEKQLRTEWEISAASEKLAECQQTILHLGKQLKVLASSRDAVVSDIKFISSPTNTSPAINISTTTPTPTLTNEKKLISQRSSLLDQMQAEDDAVAEQLESPKTKEIICDKDFSAQPAKDHITGRSMKIADNDIAVGSLAIVPIKKQQTVSGGLFKKLLWRRKKSSSKKMSLSFAP